LEGADAVESDQESTQESTFRKLFDGNPKPMWVYDLDTRRFLIVNDTAVAHYGYSREEFLAMRLDDIRPPEALADLERTVGARQQQQQDETWGSLRTLHRKKDGSVFEVEICARPAPMGGRARLVVADDVSARYRAERALQASEARYRELLEHLPDGVVVATGTRFTYANAAICKLLGYSHDELLQTERMELVHPDDRAAALAAPPLRPSDGPSPLVERRLVRKDGQVVTVELVKLGIEHEGEPQELAVVRDVSERRALQARLALADRLASVGTLAAGVAHEINNPLAYVVANLDFVSERLAQPQLPGAPELDREVLAQALKEAAEGAQRMRSIVRDLRSLSRPEGGEIQVVAVNEVIEGVVKMARVEIRHRARLVLDLQDVSPVEASEGRLHQLFLNLVMNAVQAIREGAADKNQIRISSRVERSGIAVEVSDTGQGIAAANLDRIFDPFFTTKSAIGMGLGLSVCQGIVAGLGGQISVSSEQGKGTTFRVWLPAAPESQASAESASSQGLPAPLPKAARRRARVLVIDDDIRITSVLSRVLGDAHDVVAVNNAGDALLRLAAGERYDAIFCDLMMPEMTGMDLFEELRGYGLGLERDLVFITGGVFTERAQEFLARVQNVRLEKPFDVGHVRKLVADRLRSRRS
jgi:PAS domain S-box-containing protein